MKEITIILLLAVTLPLATYANTPQEALSSLQKKQSKVRLLNSSKFSAEVIELSAEPHVAHADYNGDGIKDYAFYAEKNKSHYIYMLTSDSKSAGKYKIYCLEKHAQSKVIENYIIALPFNNKKLLSFESPVGQTIYFSFDQQGRLVREDMILKTKKMITSSTCK